MNLLVADIGGTNSRCAVATAAAGIGEVTALRNADFPGLAQLLASYLATLPAERRPDAGALAVAAPIGGDEVQMINIGWRFSRHELQRQLGLSDLRCLNDFEALAWALPALQPDEVVQVGGGEPVPNTCMGVLGPGTGLGVASLVRAGDRWHALAGEGGHVTLAAQNLEEERVIRVARERFGHCSAERLLSGPGLIFLHQALHAEPGLAAEEIGRRADAGDGKAQATLESFFRLLGTVAGNLALTVGASGGVYIGGGIVPRYLEAFRRSGFRARFESKGRYEAFMRRIPTWVITAKYPALTGLVACARSL
jgi:glucokinase